MSEECCNFCGEIAENEETVWGWLYWCDACEDAARWTIYDGVARKIGR